MNSRVLVAGPGATLVPAAREGAAGRGARTLPSVTSSLISPSHAWCPWRAIWVFRFDPAHGNEDQAKVDTLFSSPCRAAWSATGPEMTVWLWSLAISRPSNQAVQR